MTAPPARTAVIVVPDLFFATRIQETARAAGVTLVAAAAPALVETCRAQRPALVIVELEAGSPTLAAVRGLARDPGTAAIPIVGFYSHVDQETRRAAEAAGVGLVLPRSAFTARLADLLTGRYTPGLRSATSPSAHETMSHERVTPEPVHAERVRISCPGCGRNDFVTWPAEQATYHWTCFNCGKTFDLRRPGGH